METAWIHVAGFDILVNIRLWPANCFNRYVAETTCPTGMCREIFSQVGNSSQNALVQLELFMYGHIVHGHKVDNSKII